DQVAERVDVEVGVLLECLLGGVVETLGLVLLLLRLRAAALHGGLGRLRLLGGLLGLGVVVALGRGRLAAERAGLDLEFRGVDAERQGGLVDGDALNDLPAEADLLGSEGAGEREERLDAGLAVEVEVELDVVRGHGDLSIPWGGARRPEGGGTPRAAEAGGQKFGCAPNEVAHGSGCPPWAGGWACWGAWAGAPCCCG